MDQIYKELLDSFEQIGEPDDKAEEFIDDIREDIEGLAKDYTEDESSEFRLSNILADDDYLLEELTDRVAYLNFVEANTGGKIAESGVSKEELENAYCISVHKSQGSEFAAVVLPLVAGPRMLMTRNLLYTAVRIMMISWSGARELSEPSAM